MKNKSKWLHKDCDFCLENWWNGKEFITETCILHEKWSYEYYLKELKKGKKEARDNLFSTVFLLMLVSVFAVFSLWLVIDSKHNNFALELIQLFLSFLYSFVHSYIVFKMMKYYNGNVEKTKNELAKYKKYK